MLTRIDGRTGHPIHNGRKGEDIFPNEEQALRYLVQERKLVCRSKQRFPALLGMTRTNGKAHLLIAQRVRHDVHLFGGHMINTLVHTSWVEVALSFPFPEVKDAAKNEKLLHEVPSQPAQHPLPTAGALEERETRTMKRDSSLIGMERRREGERMRRWNGGRARGCERERECVCEPLCVCA